MRLAPLVLLVACTRSTTPKGQHGDEARVTPDATPAPVAVAPADAAGPCFHGADLDRYADGALVLCDWGIVGDGRSCVAVAANGELTPVEQRAPLPEAEIDGVLAAGKPMDYDAAKVCQTPDACTTLRPKRAKGQQVTSAGVDAKGARAAILLGAFDGTVTTSLEVWDVAKAKLLAHVDLPRQSDLVPSEVSFLGDTILLRLHDQHLDADVGSLWSLAGKKLTSVASLPGVLRGSGIVAAGHAAFALDDDVVIYDLATGTALGSSPWTGLLDDAGRARRAQDGGAYVWLAGADDVVGALVTTLDLQTMGAGVVSPLGGAPSQRYPISVCPIEDPPEPINER